jgi:hypothetical protein
MESRNRGREQDGLYKKLPYTTPVAEQDIAALRLPEGSHLA